MHKCHPVFIIVKLQHFAPCSLIAAVHWHVKLCREYDRLEADAARQHCKPKYALSSADHETLVKSTLELACNPKLKGRVPSAIKEVLANAAALEELTVGMVRACPPFECQDQDQMGLHHTDQFELLTHKTCDSDAVVLPALVCTYLRILTHVSPFARCMHIIYHGQYMGAKPCSTPVN